MDIQRKAELFVCAVLAAALPGRRFLPAKGLESDGQNDEAPAVEVPYTAVAVLEAEDLVSGENTWLLTMAATYVTHVDDTQPTGHSEAVREIQDVLRMLPRGFRGEQKIIVHGADVQGIAEVEDDRRQSHADVITFALGCSG
jgi:hypothetical protein